MLQRDLQKKPEQEGLSITLFSAMGEYHICHVICTKDNKYRRWLREAVEISRQGPGDDEPGRGSRRALSHLEQHHGEADRQREAWPTCHSGQVGRASITSADKTRHTHHFLTLLGKAEVPSKHFKKVRQTKKTLLLTKEKLCKTMRWWT